MEESANDALYIGVYVLIFISALSITIFLFTNIVKYAEKSYEFGQNETGSTVNNNAGTTYDVGQDKVYLTTDEVVSYYYNYIKKDQYDSTAAGNVEYHVTIYYNTADPNKKYETDTTSSNLNYETLMSSLKCSNNEKYVLEYIKEEVSGSTIKKYIDIKKINV